MSRRVRTILLVDDDEAFLDTLAKRCEQRGFRTLTATDSAEALRIAWSEKVDVAVVDLRLPDRDGLETITRLRQIRPSTVTILLTAFGDERLREATEALSSVYFDKEDMSGLWRFLEGTPFGAANVLLVDDDERLLEVLSRRIRARGHEALTATTSAAAIEIARKLPVQLAVVDLQLPDTDGLVTITRLKEVQPGVETVLLTGHGDEKLREATEALNSTYFDKEDMGGFWGFVRRVLGKLETTMAAAGLATGGDVENARELSSSGESPDPDRESEPRDRPADGSSGRADPPKT
jgi:ActR/RegA family two-component response regulator